MVNSNFNLVIYTDVHTREYVEDKGRPNVKVVVKPMNRFYNCKYKEAWEKNHKKNTLLKNVSHWKLNMLWSEKIAFVKETAEQRYFDTDWYGWCDIGYFRNRECDTPIAELMHWPSIDIVASLDRAKIVYGVINNDDVVLQQLQATVNDRNEQGVPRTPIPPTQTSISGGFFLVHRDKIAWWFELYDATLSTYFKNEYLVKDDQMILVDCIFRKEHSSHFLLCRENKPPFDNWFMFQRILNTPMPPHVPAPTPAPAPVQLHPVSILMPVFNGVEYIREAVASVLAQTVSCWELIIGVNGHPLNSEVYRLAKQCEMMDAMTTTTTLTSSRIRVVELYPICGKSNAMNKMLELCRYDRVAVLDVDDVWMSNKLAVQMPFLEMYDVVGTQCVYFGDSMLAGRSPAIPMGDLSQFDFTQMNPLINSSTIIRKELCQWDASWDGVEDYDLWLRLKWKGQPLARFYNCSEVLVKHRLHANSAFNANGNHLRVSDLVQKYKQPSSSSRW